MPVPAQFTIADVMKWADIVGNAESRECLQAVRDGTPNAIETHRMECKTQDELDALDGLIAAATLFQNDPQYADALKVYLPPELDP